MMTEMISSLERLTQSSMKHTGSRDSRRPEVAVAQPSTMDTWWGSDE